MPGKNQKYVCPKCGEDVTDRVSREIGKIVSGGDKTAGYISVADFSSHADQTSLPETVNIQCSKGDWASYTIR